MARRRGVSWACISRIVAKEKMSRTALEIVAQWRAHVAFSPNVPIVP
ncbi:hypothetical protein JXA88_12895 [Candidatus Fermentibacteria bacterium]|nr:hypothetical protein [Candidatus Fermentibacteria bacterium]